MNGAWSSFRRAPLPSPGNAALVFTDYMGVEQGALAGDPYRAFPLFSPTLYVPVILPPQTSGGTPISGSIAPSPLELNPNIVQPPFLIG